MNKKLYIISLLLFCAPLFVFAQNTTIKEAYVYASCATLDLHTNEIIEQMDGVHGVIMFTTDGENDIFVLSIGGDIVYGGTVSLVREGLREGNISSTTYLVLQEVQGQIVPLRIYKVFDSSHSSFIPKEFVVQTLHKDTYEVVQNMTFQNISRTN